MLASSYLRGPIRPDVVLLDLAMLEAGATGHLSKASRGREVVQAVRAAAAGEYGWE